MLLDSLEPEANQEGGKTRRAAPTWSNAAAQPLD
jgi:hypothetical protein